MKKMFLLLSVLISGIAISCMDGEKDLYKREEPKDPKEILEGYVMTKKFDVPVTDGYKTIVKLGDEIIYEGNIPMTIDVPKFNTTSTRSNLNLTWHQVQLPEDNTGWRAFSRKYGILLFEDMYNGDNDYNDFVCGVVEVINYDGSSKDVFTTSVGNIRVMPYALGNTLPLKFGIEFRDGKGTLLNQFSLSEDIRKDYFGNATGFINTTADGTIMKIRRDITESSYPTGAQIAENIKAGDFYALWYIESEGVKRYAADACIFINQGIEEDELITNDNVPFGLFVPNVGINTSTWNTTFKWMTETESIFSGYQNFEGWVKNLNDNPFSSKNENLLFDTSVIF